MPGRCATPGPAQRPAAHAARRSRERTFLNLLATALVSAARCGPTPRRLECKLGLDMPGPAAWTTQWLQDIAAFKAALVQWLRARLQASPWLLPDLWEDSDNKPGLHRMQNLVFSLLLGALFIRAAIQADAMMDLGENQLALSGISGTCHIGFKRRSNRT